jgi:hypothetical protein
MFFPFFYDWCVGFGTGDVIERIDEIFFLILKDSQLIKNNVGRTQSD